MYEAKKEGSYQFIFCMHKQSFNTFEAQRDLCRRVANIVLDKKEVLEKKYWFFGVGEDAVKVKKTNINLFGDFYDKVKKEFGWKIAHCIGYQFEEYSDLDFSILMNDFGVIEDKEKNEVATRTLFKIPLGWAFKDYLKGNFIVCCSASKIDGELVSIPDDMDLKKFMRLCQKEHQRRKEGLDDKWVGCVIERQEEEEEPKPEPISEQKRKKKGVWLNDFLIHFSFISPEFKKRTYDLLRASPDSKIEVFIHSFEKLNDEQYLIHLEVGFPNGDQIEWEYGSYYCYPDNSSVAFWSSLMKQDDRTNYNEFVAFLEQNKEQLREEA
jgi:hypothetical protein